MTITATDLRTAAWDLRMRVEEWSKMAEMPKNKWRRGLLLDSANHRARLASEFLAEADKMEKPPC